MVDLCAGYSQAMTLGNENLYRPHIFPDRQASLSGGGGIFRSCSLRVSDCVPTHVAN